MNKAKLLESPKKKARTVRESKLIRRKS